jgi:hypothetical protein
VFRRSKRRVTFCTWVKLNAVVVRADASAQKAKILCVTGCDEPRRAAWLLSKVGRFATSGDLCYFVNRGDKCRTAVENIDGPFISEAVREQHSMRGAAIVVRIELGYQQDRCTVRPCLLIFKRLDPTAIPPLYRVSIGPEICEPGAPASGKLQHRV